MKPTRGWVDVKTSMEWDHQATCRAGPEKAFTDVTFCVFKLRKLEFSHRSIATITSAWVIYILMVTSLYSFIINKVYLILLGHALIVCKAYRL